MTKKDYELLAACVSRSRMAVGITRNAKDRTASLSGVRLVAIDLAATLAHENPRFDLDRFMRCAGFAALTRTVLGEGGDAL